MLDQHNSDSGWKHAAEDATLAANEAAFEEGFGGLGDETSAQNRERFGDGNDYDQQVSTLLGKWFSGERVTLTNPAVGQQRHVSKAVRTREHKACGRGGLPRSA